MSTIVIDYLDLHLTNQPEGLVFNIVSTIGYPSIYSSSGGKDEYDKDETLK